MAEVEAYAAAVFGVVAEHRVVRDAAPGDRAVQDERPTAYLLVASRDLSARYRKALYCRSSVDCHNPLVRRACCRSLLDNCLVPATTNKRYAARHHQLHVDLEKPCAEINGSSRYLKHCSVNRFLNLVPGRSRITLDRQERFPRRSCEIISHRCAHRALRVVLNDEFVVICPFRGQVGNHIAERSNRARDDQHWLAVASVFRAKRKIDIAGRGNVIPNRDNFARDCRNRRPWVYRHRSNLWRQGRPARILRSNDPTRVYARLVGAGLDRRRVGDVYRTVVGRT